VKSFKIVLVLSLFSLLITGSAMATTVTKLSGYIGYANSYNTYAWGANVKACLDPTGEDIYSCRGGTTNSSGYYQWSGSWNVPNSATLYYFAWVTGGPGGRQGTWGSPTIPVGTATAASVLSRSYFLFPAPLEVSAVYPANYATNVPLQVTLKWTNASDVHRQYWPTTYDIYGSGYGAPLILEAGNVQCNPDAQNNCQWVIPIVLDPQTPYNWQIVAKNTVGYQTESQVFHFTTGY
jgi:hypothetical protein